MMKRQVVLQNTIFHDKRKVERTIRKIPPKTIATLHYITQEVTNGPALLKLENFDVLATVKNGETTLPCFNLSSVEKQQRSIVMKAKPINLEEFRRKSILITAEKRETIAKKHSLTTYYGWKK